MHRLWGEGDLVTAGLEARSFISGSVTIPRGHAQIYPFVLPSQSGIRVFTGLYLLISCLSRYAAA